MAGETDDQELQRALFMSLQQPPEPMKPCDGEPPQDADARIRSQRELLAAAAEKRMLAFQKPPEIISEVHPPSPIRGRSSHQLQEVGKSLSPPDAERLFLLVFGSRVNPDVVAQWCNQGFRFSMDQDTSLGLVQREGGPCGVLAPVQAILLKYLLFEQGGILNGSSRRGDNNRLLLQNLSDATSKPVLTFSDSQRTRALVSAMAEILWLIGGKSKSIVAVLNVNSLLPRDIVKEEEQDEVLSKRLEDVSLSSAADLHRHISIHIFSSASSLFQQLTALLPMFRSRFGALLFLFSALLSRGLDTVHLDRDDPGQPLVTAPFGHASQEIVNLLICGQAVPNVFDGHMDIGGGMQLKGIPSNVEVGFLTLLEALNLCKVGQYLKRPKWPIWVVGSESHYTVLFALDHSIQVENELEDRERHIRQAFDLHDQSGGGGFIGAQSVQQLLHDMNISMPQGMLENLCSSDFVVWNEMLQALHQIEKEKGGLKDGDSVRGMKQFELFHFNGIAKAVGGSNTGVIIQQQPRLIKLQVTVPPKWTPEEFMVPSGSSMDLDKDKTQKEEPVQQAPLVDCIKTRWQRATCKWNGDAPSIV